MIDKAAEYLFMQGLLGVWAALATGGMVWAVLGWLSEKEKRLQDVKENARIYAETSKEQVTVNSTMQQSIDALVTLFKKK